MWQRHFWEPMLIQSLKNYKHQFFKLKKSNGMKIVIGLLSLTCCLVVLTSLSGPYIPDKGIEPAIAFFKIEAAGFAKATDELMQAIDSIERNNPVNLRKAREALKKCRLHYKRIEFFLDYFFSTAAVIYNAPAKYEIEEPYMEFQEPIGLQVIEGLLYEKNPYAKKEELKQQADAINSSATDLGSLLYSFHADDSKLLESIRIHLLKVITLGITGFDAPFLKSGMEEAEVSLVTMHHILAPFLDGGSPTAVAVDTLFKESIEYLQINTNFDTADRLSFLKTYALPLQYQLSLLIKELGLYLDTGNGIVNYEARDIFSKDALNITVFAEKNDWRKKEELIELGKQLFFETGLSGNNKISCATCHRPENYFSEPQPKSIAFDGHSFVQRNAPTLFYAGYQHEQFWDGRAKSLEEQVKTVINNPQEMNGSVALNTLTARLPGYANSFKEVFGKEEDSLLSGDKVAYAIAAYIRELNPRDSRFDRYLHGEENLLTAAEKRGFNLFMGKAQCGTCHFAPLFNGLVPPFYNLSELEVLGTLETDDLGKPRLDKDRGRVEIFPMDFYEQAFKTPTVRNVSVTAPYMHNGAFRTLDSVVEFYNKGGAAGLGLSISNQTMSSTPLNLSGQEVRDVVSFLHSLKDSCSYMGDRIKVATK